MERLYECGYRVAELQRMPRRITHNDISAFPLFNSTTIRHEIPFKRMSDGI